MELRARRTGVENMGGKETQKGEMTVQMREETEVDLGKAEGCTGDNWGCTGDTAGEMKVV